ncbi:MBL fold metallo-hydrolase [Albibacterium bauzanense]|uniref:L-ascorbate metabolism protein UlaG (Beta-lactamase superfamily) n=1 Tax=Albibacterium bauzanense TaxID=653929 RepID=A0A4R1M0J8_9SPHI|nr:MBL fold metallo-hydrolase [Albibacterium bauzanense]TCK85135.1 L-ascorbate metabolism protein UlaG (beta-lactamase superfamily) [Albibacterium bauzanense]
MKDRRITQSKNYKNGSFQNLSSTPTMAPDVSFISILKDMFRRPKSVRPQHMIPSVKTDLKLLFSKEPLIVWFGHSSYLIHCNGKNILVDPVFSGHASPMSFMVKAFNGSNVYTAEDMPEIDLLILTHNHYDHMDVQTINKLTGKVKNYLTTIGVKRSLINLGIPGYAITDLDWWEKEEYNEHLILTATPARHFSGRGIRRGGSLWASFVLEMEGYKIFIGGDSGYDSHFKLIGETFGPFDIAILECGQYNTSWPFIHMMPEETVQACIDLNAATLFPVHWGKFALANHPWDEPIQRVKQSADQKGLRMIAPMIGEPIMIRKNQPDNEQTASDSYLQKEWWKLDL